MNEQLKKMSRSTDIFRPLDMKNRAEALYYSIVYDSYRAILAAALHELEAAVKCVPEPAEVVNILSAYLQVNLDMAAHASQCAMSQLVSFLKLEKLQRFEE